MGRGIRYGNTEGISWRCEGHGLKLINGNGSQLMTIQKAMQKQNWGPQKIERFFGVLVG